MGAQGGFFWMCDDYRFGFNGKENDKDWGNQLIQDYGFRLYNPAIGKFLSVDPLSPEYPELTPYQFASNRPIDGIDLDGLEWKFKVNDTYRVDPKTGKTDYSTIIRDVEVDIKVEVFNNSGEVLHMQNYVDAIAIDIEEAYESVSGQSISRNRNWTEWWNGSTNEKTNIVYQVNVNVDIKEIDKASQKSNNSMLVEILPNGTAPQLGPSGKSYGRAPFFGNQVYVNAKYAEKQINSTDNNTLPHELGHTGGLKHPDTESQCTSSSCGHSQWIDPKREPKNAMYSGGSGLLNDATSTKFTAKQLQTIIDNYNDGNLNQNTVGK